MMMRILAADRVKMRRTWIGILVVLGPLGVIALQAVNYSLRYDYLVQPDSDVWADLIGNVHFMLVPALLLGITLLASMTIGMEQQSHAWKQILTLPVPKMQIYMGKFLGLAGLLLVSAVLAGTGTIILGLWLGFGPEIPWMMVLGEGLLPYFASFPVIALQLWVSTVVRNQAFPMTLGIIGTILSMSLSLSESLTWIPWAYPALAAPLEMGLYNPEKWVTVGLTLGVILSFLGAVHFSKKDVR